MSSPAFDATIELAPRPSVRALTLVFGLHVVLLALLLFALQPGPGMAGLAGLTAVSWVAMRRHPVFGFGPNALSRLTWHADGAWSVHDTRGARWDGVKLLGSSLVHDRLLVLNFKLPDGERRTRALLGDELPDEQLRRLRARLRLERGASG